MSGAGYIQGFPDASASTIANLLLNPSGGTVGIGTTSPPAVLTVQGTGIFTDNVSYGNATVGSSTIPGVLIFGQASTPNYGEIDYYKAVSGTKNAANFIYNGGSVGTITYSNTATAYNTTSDRRTKENIATTTLGLDALMQLPVRDFNFIKDPTHAMATGFIAQELFKVFPYAITTNGENGADPIGATSTPLSIDYGHIMPLIAKAVQDIANITGVFKSNLIAWFDSADNGIQDFYAGIFHAREGGFSEKLCVGSTCVTRINSKRCSTRSQIHRVPDRKTPTVRRARRKPLSLSKASTRWFALHARRHERDRLLDNHRRHHPARHHHHSILGPSAKQPSLAHRDP